MRRILGTVGSTSARLLLPKSGSSILLTSIAYFRTVFGLWITCVGLALLFADPNPLCTAELNAERLRLIVVDPKKAAFHIAGAHIGELGAPEPSQCSDGLFTPARGAVIVYGRVAAGPVEITVTPPPQSNRAASQDIPNSALAGRFQPAFDRPAIDLTGATSIVVADECRKPASQRFPLWGLMQIGQEFRPAASANGPEPNLLLGGKIDVAAHAVFSKTLYQAASVNVPVGARLQTYAPDQEGVHDEPIWWGVATVDAEHPALLVRVATEAPGLALYRPNQTKADVIQVWAWSQLQSDPDIVLITILVGTAFWVFSQSVTIAELLHKHRGG